MGAPMRSAMSIALQIFGRVRLAERPAHEAPVLRERHDHLPVHATRRDADAVAVSALPVHAPVARLVMDEGVELFVSTLVEEQRQAPGRGRDRLEGAVLGLVDGRGRYAHDLAFMDTRLDGT